MELLSLLLPLAYLTVLVGSLATFSSLYRRRQAVRAATLEPWFGPHLQRNVYLSLLELQSNPTATSTPGSDLASPKVPDSLLKAALLRRAIEDVHRLLQLRSQKPALGQLLQRGSVGDDLWQRFLLAEKEMEHELKDVVSEANALAPQQQWGTTILQSASEAAHREALTKRLKAIEDGRDKAVADWEARRADVAAGFLKELDGSGTSIAKGGADKKTASSSDEDGVLVEAGGPAEGSKSQPAQVAHATGPEAAEAAATAPATPAAKGPAGTNTPASKKKKKGKS